MPQNLIARSITRLSSFIKRYIHKQPGPRLNIKTIFPVMGTPMLKIRRSRDCLNFNMGIPKLVRRRLYIETAPRYHVPFGGRGFLPRLRASRSRAAFFLRMAWSSGETICFASSNRSFTERSCEAGIREGLFIESVAFLLQGGVLSGLILGLRPANERRHCFVKTSLIG